MNTGVASERGIEHQGSHLDLWLALLAGDRVWADGDDAASTREQAVSAILLLALAVTLLVQWVALAGRIDMFADDGIPLFERRLLVLSALSVVAAGAIAVRPVRLLTGRSRSHPGFVPSLLWRSIAFVVLIASTAAVITRFSMLAAVPLGLLGGADALLTLWVVGVRPAPLRWAKRFLFSTVHFGVIGAILFSALTERSQTAFGALLEIYVAMWVGVVVAGVTVVGMNELSARVDRQQAARADDVRAAERSKRAHWLHDDVLSEVQLSVLRLKHAGDLEAAQLELDDLEHRLRLRQLYEVINGGTPHIYEVLQPHLRRAQSLGVHLFRVPALEDTDVVIDSASAELLHRVVSVTTSNSLNAGATRMAIDVERPAIDRIRITITDDAGGFDLDDIPLGRGLATLRTDLGRGAIDRLATDDGSAISVVLPITTPASVET